MVRMRLIERNDASLAIGLIVGTILLFHQPLQFAFDIADDLRLRYGVDLVQALVVLAVVFAFHQYRKRQEARTQAVTAAAEARYAQSRSESLERLIEMSRALAGATDFTTLGHALLRHLPGFIGERAHSVVVHSHGNWDVLLRDGAEGHVMERWEAASIDALRRTASAASPDTAGAEYVTVPVLDGAQPIALFVVHNSPAVLPEVRQSLEAVAAFTAVTMRNVQILLDTRDQSVRDGLTGCVNRTHALSAATAELRRARRHNRPLSIVMFDVDHFKDVNDTYGHLVGDQVLAEIGRRLEDVVRMSDIKCRYGGDEFLIILPDTPMMGAQHVAESLLSTMSAIAIPAASAADPVAPSVSIGVAGLRADDRDIVSLIARADRALYDAKQRGRNCVSFDRAGTASPLRLMGTA